MKPVKEAANQAAKAGEKTESIFRFFNVVPEKSARDSMIHKQSYQIPGETSLENIPKRFGRGTGLLIAMENYFRKSNFGGYPKGYNPKVHGPFYPHRSYGTADTSLMDTKLKEIPSWLGRRNFSPRGMIGCVNRKWWGWRMRWLLPKRPGHIPFSQVAFGLFVWYWFWGYNMMKEERHAKYH